MNQNVSTLENIKIWTNMSNNTTTNGGTDLSTSSKIIVVTFLSAVCVLILLGNALVILAFVKGPRRLRTYTNFFVVNLAISDLMVGCLSVPFWICLELDKTSEDTDKFFIALDILFGATSILSLAAISLERMYAVNYPARHMNLSRRTVHVSIAFTWIVGAGLTVVNVTLFQQHSKIVTILIFVSAFIIPLTVIIISYVFLFVAAFNLMEADNHQKNNISREIQIAKTISVIIGLFVICWSPFFCVNITYVYCSTCTNNWTLAISISKLLHYSNSMMNFFVYAVRSPDFRETFKALVYKCDTSEVRERLRSISFRSTRSTRSSTLLSKRSNNNGSIRVEQSKSLFVNREYKSQSLTEHSDDQPAVTGSESPTIGFISYDCMEFDK